ncbi:hypothetical protein FOA52_007400 [Chlamydomonas sp. UWO 241]|nr:hypothetical protein FOA52_007400 [Chlamydomonas sp. UWO 241]
MFPGMPGMPPGGGPGGMPGNFDFSALQKALDDPAIKEMAEKIANDPAFAAVTQSLQASMGGMGGAGGMPGMPPGGMPGMPPDMSQMDPSKYMEAMSGMFQNQNFMQMAEQLGKTIIEADPNMANMMKSMQDPSYKDKMQGAMEAMKTDPELAPMMADLEAQGPMAMMKYWNDPAMLEKLGKAMNGTGFDFAALAAQGAGGAAQEEEGEHEPEEEEEENLHSAASAGDVEAIKALLEAGAKPDEADDEGRTALHFACGYGEIECAMALIAAKASLNIIDNNKNTPLHYAAGYGQAESVKLLIDSGADRAALNSDGKTALEVATLNEQEDVIAALSA